MKASKLIPFFFIIFNFCSSAQEKFPSYYSQNDMEFATPGTIIFGLGGYSNPAVLIIFISAKSYFYLE